MPDNMKTILITAGTIILTAIIFALIFGIFNKGKSATEQNANSIDKYLMTGAEAFEDGAVVKGSAVIDAIRNVMSSDETYDVIVVNGTDATSTYGSGSTIDAGATAVTDNAANKYTDKSLGSYVNPTKNYTTTVNTDNNGVVTTVTFTRQ